MSNEPGPISRREFIGYGLSTLLAEPLFAKNFSAPPSRTLGIVSGGVKWRRNGKERFSLAFADLDRRKVDVVDAALFAHSVNHNPFKEGLAVAIERRGRGVALVDVKRAKIVNSASSDPNRVYYGHGAFNESKNSVFVTTLVKSDQESDFNSWPVIVSELDLSTLEVLRESGPLGTIPHDIKYLSSTKNLIVPVGHGPSGKTELIFLESSSMAIKRRIVSHSPVHGALAHMSFGSHISLVCTVNRQDKDGIGSGDIHVIKDNSGEFSYIPLPEKVKSKTQNQLLSIVLSPDDRYVMATIPYNNRVVAIDLKTGELGHSYQYPLPMGLSLTMNKDFYVIAARDTPRICRR